MEKKTTITVESLVVCGVYIWNWSFALVRLRIGGRTSWHVKSVNLAGAR